jgi:hypothetical protein
MLLLAVLLAMLLAAAAAAVGGARGAQVVLTPPLVPERGGRATLLVSVPGAFVPGAEYAPVVAATRSAANLTLWTAVLTDFALDFPTPPEVDAGVRAAVAAAREAGACLHAHAGRGTLAHRRTPPAGFADITDDDVWLIAHSLGGSISGDLVRNTYGGLILMGTLRPRSSLFFFVFFASAHVHVRAGSYLPGPRTEDLRTYPRPVLLLAGELDGLVQLTRAAEEYRAPYELVQAGDERTAVRAKPVVVVPGLNHAQMGNGYVTETLRAEDFPAELAQTDADAQLGAWAARFLELHRRDDDQALVDAAYAALREGVRSTEPFMRFFLEAQDEDDAAGGCAPGQRAVAALGDDAGTRLDVQVQTQASAPAFAASVPVLADASEGNGTTVLVPGYLERRVGVQSEGEAGTELQCKYKSQAAIVRALGLLPDAYGPPGDCRTVTAALLDRALAAIAPSCARRYATIGKPVALGADALAATESAWQAAALQTTETATAWTVVAASLTNPTVPSPDGPVLYCKGLPAAQLARWLLHNTLPRGLP